jgi:hypothetical protein
MLLRVVTLPMGGLVAAGCCDHGLHEPARQRLQQRQRRGLNVTARRHARRGRPV